MSLASDFRVNPNQANPNPDRNGNTSVWNFLQSASATRDPATYSLLTSFTSHSNGVNGVNVWYYWASKHPSAVNFAYCDGSVRPVTSQINKVVLTKLCTRNGGETVSSDEMK